MNWWEQTPKEVVGRIYWQRNQLPPDNWEEDWPDIKAQLMDIHPPPDSWEDPDYDPTPDEQGEPPVGWADYASGVKPR